MPTSVQLGTSLWRVDRSWGYVEAGIGAYLLSKTINNDANRLPSSFQFGSHVGAGVRIGERARIGVALQHLSNAGLKQPNGGIDLIELTGGLQF
jgi:lipid A 3-O-deacylase